MPYYSDNGLSSLKLCFHKIQFSWVKTRFIRFKTQYDVNKIKFYCNTKDKTAALWNSFVVYEFYCPDCGVNYIGKTEKKDKRTVERTVLQKDSWTCLNR